MPNVITHGLMAHEVTQIIEDNTVSQSISKYPRAFFFGSNGPDFLFYYRFLRHDEDAKKIRGIGNTLHDTHVNDFYTAAKVVIGKLKGEDKAIATSYIAGHLCHWSLDSLAHPYVFHKTGLLEGETRYGHYRIEAMIDSLMLKRIKQVKYREHPSYKFVSLSKKERMVIARVYQEIVAEVLKDRIPVKKFYNAIVSMYRYNLLLFDKTGLKTKFFSLVDKKVLRDEWFISSHMVTPDLDLEHDILNLSKDPWSHPCDAKEVYHSSFVDLFNESVGRGTKVLSCFNSDLENETDLVENFIDNRDYSTGRNDGAPMNNFDLIYQHIKEE